MIGDRRVKRFTLWYLVCAAYEDPPYQRNHRWQSLFLKVVLIWEYIVSCTKQNLSEEIIYLSYSSRSSLVNLWMCRMDGAILPSHRISVWSINMLILLLVSKRAGGSLFSWSHPFYFRFPLPFKGSQCL